VGRSGQLPGLARILPDQRPLSGELEEFPDRRPLNAIRPTTCRIELAQEVPVTLDARCRPRFSTWKPNRNRTWAAPPMASASKIVVVPQRIGLRDMSTALVGRSILATTTSRLAWPLA